MNTRQQLYKKNRMLGMSRYNAARSAGYSESTAKSHTKELDERVNIPDVLERKGLTDSVLVSKLSELLNASKVVGYLHQYKKGEKGGIEKISPDEAVSNEFIDVPDWSARAKGLELALKLKDLLKDKPIIDISKHEHYTIYRPEHYSKEDLEASSRPTGRSV